LGCAEVILCTKDTKRISQSIWNTELRKRFNSIQFNSSQPQHKGQGHTHIFVRVSEWERKQTSFDDPWLASIYSTTNFGSSIAFLFVCWRRREQRMSDTLKK
jgi:hypothetical protein